MRIISTCGGARSGAVIILRDIRERKQAERERDRLLEDLQSALARVNLLSRLLPICAACKNIRDDGGQWCQLETYIRTHCEAEFSTDSARNAPSIISPGSKWIQGRE